LLGFLFLYDQELTYTMDNPWGNPLFLLCVVTIERQERDNQMTTGVMQTELISALRSFTSEQNCGFSWQLLQVQMKILKRCEVEPRVAPTDLEIDDSGGKTTINDRA
jgi:hypothetical protein